MTEPIISHAPRFLVVRGGAIGDFIVTLPVLQALRAQWPHATIEVWGYPHIAELAVAGGWADSVVSLDRAEMARFFVPNPEFSQSQIATIRSFDLIFTYLHDAVGRVRSNFLLAGAKQVISGSPRIQHGHAVPFLLEPLQALAIFETELVPELDLSGAARAEGRKLLRQLGLRGRPIAVHPGSGGSAKKWPRDRFEQILRRCLRQGYEVVVIVGEADHEEADYFRRNMPELPVVADVSLMDLAAVLAECQLFLGNDSGITHLAAAVGLPVVALFGPTDPAVWAPRGRARIQIVQAPESELERLEISTVWQALETVRPQFGE